MAWRMSVRLPIGSEARHPVDDRAWQGAVLKTTVEQTLMRGLATAGPCSVSGLPRSRSGTSVTGPIVDHEGSPSVRRPRPCTILVRRTSCPSPCWWSWWMVGSGGSTLGLDLTCDRPGEGRHLAGDRGGDQVDVLALRHEPPEAGTQPDLSLPGDRPHCIRHAIQPGLDQTRDPRREAVAPGTLDQHPAGAAIPGL